MPTKPTPSFTKSPPELVARFDAILDRFPDAARKQMFGYPAAFLGGNMATGLFAEHWVVRLPDAEIEPAKAAGATAFEPMPGRPMKAFVIIPQTDVADDAAIEGWVRRGLDHARSMPPKT